MYQSRFLSVFGIVAIIILVTGWAAPNYPGSGWVLFAFSISFGLLAATVFGFRFSIGYFFFAVFLILGFWLKLMAHLIFGYELIEPIGAFDGSPQQWDRVLVYASLGGAGAAAGKLLATLTLDRYSSGLRTGDVIANAVPRGYPARRHALWFFFGGILVLLCAANYHFAFYQIGVEPKLVLPAHLNVFPAWLISIGFALGLAVLVNWELTYRPERIALLAAAILVQAVVISLSALSRSIIIFHTAPALIVLGIHAWSRWDRRRVIFAASAVLLATAVVAASVTTIRFLTYPLPPSQSVRNSVTSQIEQLTPLQALKSADVDEPSKAEIRKGIRTEIVRQLGKLIIGRWIGVEGVMAVASSPKAGYPLFLEALREDPRLGNHSLYQGIARADSYMRQSKAGQFTFLTLPGVMGILTYSGSRSAVFFGMLLIAVTLLTIERLSLIATRNAFFAITGSVALANVFVQMNFPYLSAIFLAQLLVATGIVWLLQRWFIVPWRVR